MMEKTKDWLLDVCLVEKTGNVMERTKVCLSDVSLVEMTAHMTVTMLDCSLEVPDTPI